MSIPYTQPTIANVRVGSGTFISYPFLTDGDTTTKVYNMACSQRASDYAANQVALDDTMSSASAAGVIALPEKHESDSEDEEEEFRREAMSRVIRGGVAYGSDDESSDFE